MFRVKKPIFLVVDDEEALRTMMARCLGKYFGEAEVSTADNPDYACVVIEELIRQDKRPDMVFTDFSMSPYGTGLPVIELCKKYGVPVVLVCSDKQDHKDFRTARELAGENFIEKPVDGPGIKAMAERILCNKA